jgi:phosphatidylglycerophosphatase C
MKQQKDAPFPKPIIAAFDFDGTITTRDVLPSFLIHAQISRQQMKEIILSRFFKGMAETKIHTLAKAFSNSPSFKRLLRPEALRRIYWHQLQGHRLILISAAIDAALIPWAQLVRFDQIIASKLEISPQGRITGHLIGLNCWGPEKVRRLEELVGPRETFVLYAYGNSRGDKELLNSADFAFLREMPQSCLDKTKRN